MQVAFQNSSKSELFIRISLFALIILSVLVRLHFISLPLERDEGEYAYAGWRMIHGGIPYRDYYNMKLPGTYAGYAFLFFLFGANLFAVRFGLILINILSCFLVAMIGRKLIHKKAGWYAAICFLLLSLTVESQGIIANAEHFVILFVLASLVFLLIGLERNHVWQFFACGSFAGLAFLMKQHSFFFAIFIGLSILIGLWQKKLLIRTILGRELSFIGGLMTPFLITVIILWISGASQNFWFFTFSYARQYVSYVSFSQGISHFISTFKIIVGPNKFLWLLVIAGVLLSFIQKRIWLIWFLNAFLFFSFLAVVPGFYFRPHYFIFLLPAAALMAAYMIISIELSKQKIIGRYIPPIYLLVCISYFFYAEWNYLFSLSNNQLLRRMYGLNPFPEAMKAGIFISEQTKPEDKVAIFGAEPEIWFYAHRQAASGYLYVYPFLEKQKYARQMLTEYFEETVKNKPAILVYSSNMDTWDRDLDIQKEIYSWYVAYRDSSFERIALIDQVNDSTTDYYWKNEALRAPVNSTHCIEIYKRKN